MTTMSNHSATTGHFIALAVLALCAASVAGQETAAAGEPDTRNLERLEGRIRELLDQHGVPAASVALVDRDRVLWAAGIGVADKATDRQATADTIFRVGSITKSFTSLAVLRFVEDGRVRLDDRVRDLIPDVAFENPWAESDPIVLAHLLEHTTGFDDIHLPEYAHSRGDPPLTLDQGLAFHPHSRTSRWRPGHYMSYCNTGPGMAGAVLERLAGRPFEEILGEEVLRPLGMTTATLLEPEGAAVATGYQADGETPGEYWHITTRPSGALSASAREMAGLVRMFLGRGTVDGVQVLQASSIERMERPATTTAARAGLAAGYGLSNYLVQHEGFVWHGHAGGMNTFVADYGYNLEHGIGFYVGINVANGRALREIAGVLRDALTRDLEASPARPVEVSAADLAAVEGTYRDFTPRQELGRFLGGYAGIAVVRHRGGHLYLGSAVGLGDRLLPLGSDRFRGEDDGRASWVYLPGTEDGDLLLGRRNYRRVSAFGVWLRWIVTALCAMLMATSVIFAMVWGPRMAARRLRGAGPPFPRASLARRLQPLVAVLVLVLSLACFGFGMADPIARLGTPTFLAVAFAAGTLAFAVLALASTVGWWRTRGEEGVGRAARVHSLLVNVALLLTVAALASWGLLGLRSWS